MQLPFKASAIKPKEVFRTLELDDFLLTPSRAQMHPNCSSRKLPEANIQGPCAVGQWEKVRW